MGRRTPDFHFRAGGIEGAVGIEPAATTTAAAIVAAAIVTVLRPAAASARAFHVCPIRLLCQSCPSFLANRQTANGLPAAGVKLRFRVPCPPHLRRLAHALLPASRAESHDSTLPKVVYRRAFSKGHGQAFSRITALGIPARSGAIFAKLQPGTLRKQRFHGRRPGRLRFPVRHTPRVLEDAGQQSWPGRDRPQAHPGRHPAQRGVRNGTLPALNF